MRQTGSDGVVDIILHARNIHLSALSALVFVGAGRSLLNVFSVADLLTGGQIFRLIAITMIVDAGFLLIFAHS